MKTLDLSWVGFGGGLGSVLRWLTDRLIHQLYKGDFPVATIFINVSGAFMIGYLSVLIGADWHERFGAELIAGVLTGGLGGYTTFSTMQLDAVNLAGRSRASALAYLLFSVMAGLGAAALGAALARL